MTVIEPMLMVKPLIRQSAAGNQRHVSAVIITSGNVMRCSSSNSGRRRSPIFLIACLAFASGRAPPNGRAAFGFRQVQHTAKATALNWRADCRQRMQDKNARPFLHISGRDIDSEGAAARSKASRLPCRRNGKSTKPCRHCGLYVYHPWVAGKTASSTPPWFFRRARRSLPALVDAAMRLRLAATALAAICLSPADGCCFGRFEMAAAGRGIPHRRKLPSSPASQDTAR